MVQAQFPESQKQYDLVLGTYQICILMMFNQKKAISFQEIKEATMFDDDACTKNIKSFMIKQKILERQSESQSSSFHNEDMFMVNEKFTSQIKKVNLPIPQIEEVYKKGSHIIIHLTYTVS
ncbi:MAG: cullin [Candidatus Roizmanbacteria bacterium]